jgi:cobalt-precorrin 5A hydrolase
VSKLAILVLTPRGLDLGRRLVETLGDGEVVAVAGQTRPMLEDCFRAGRPLVCIMALGIVVRILGPLAQNKQSDPPVVVVDEAGQFAISVLGGHGAGANDLARAVANALGAVPVITTASDVLGLPAIDLIGRTWGWTLEEDSDTTALAAAVIRGEPIGVFQEAGRRDWWSVFGIWPPSFRKIDAWPPTGQWGGLLIISDRELRAVADWPAVVYRPASLVLGIGCRRGTSFADINELFKHVWSTWHLSQASLRSLATAEIKRNEIGLLAFAASLGKELGGWSLDDLRQIKVVPTPSQKVYDKFGVWGVAEPAALLAAEPGELIVPKQRSRNVTMAVARRFDA